MRTIVRPRIVHPARRGGATARHLPGLALLILVAVIGGIFVRDHAGHQGGTDRGLAVTRGRYDFATGSCISCHTLYPISAAGGAVDLTHEGGKRTLTWLRHEIRFPTSARPPTPAGQADDLAVFLSSLK